MHYLDNAATTRVSPPVAELILRVMASHWANPSALYRPGMEAEAVIGDARDTLAQALGCGADEVFFTASGTEGNNIALLGAARCRKGWGNHIVTTGYEHPSVQSPLAMLAEREGFTLTVVPPGPDGRVPLDALVSAVGPTTVLVGAMQVNNESGAVLDVAALAAQVKEKNPRTFVHIDGVQGFCRLPLRLADTRIDGYAVTGHKIHAPKGIGALYLRRGHNLWPPFLGGGHERGVRPGTENTPYIAGFAEAAQMAMARRDADLAQMVRLRERLLAGLAQMEGVQVHSPPDGQPGILLFSMPKGLKSQVMLTRLYDDYAVCVSSGSACSGGKASHTLAAMGVSDWQIDAALRVSFCGENTEADIDALLDGLGDCVQTLQRK